MKKNKKEKEWHISGNKPKEYLAEYIQETEKEMFDNAPMGIGGVNLSLIALHAMMKPRLDVIIALLYDIRNKDSNA